jgi:hypothetical protein
MQSVSKHKKRAASNQAFVELTGWRTYLGRQVSKTCVLEYNRLIGEWLQDGRQHWQDDRGGSSLSVVELVAYHHFAQT